MILTRLKFCVWALLLGLAASSLSDATILREDVGVLRIHDLLLRPNFFFGEGGQGSFSMGESSFALRWELEEKYIGVIRLGPRTLINPLARFSSTVEDDLVAVEAYAELNTTYGKFRLGRLPIEFGYEGRLWERQLIFPRSMLFRERITMLRDLGVSYEVTHNHYITSITVHNGESDSDRDGRLWYTARWGYGTEKFDLGIAGQTGDTKAPQTQTSSDTLAGVDPTYNAHWRMGGIYGALHKKTWEWSLEYYMGNRIQDESVASGGAGKYLVGHTDFTFDLTRYYSVGLRYDHFDPNEDIKNDLKRELSLALTLSNRSHSSNLILIGTKVFEESGQIGNDELRLIWSLSPSGIVRF